VAGAACTVCLISATLILSPPGVYSYQGVALILALRRRIASGLLAASHADLLWFHVVCARDVYKPKSQKIVCRKKHPQVPLLEKVGPKWER
jgi:hypothetical protein